VRFSLELITRDALKVPCLTKAYWVTFRDIPARDLANTLAMIRNHPAQNLQKVSVLPPQEQVILETANLKSSLKYARNILEI
jgi:hypothetical protein